MGADYKDYKIAIRDAGVFFFKLVFITYRTRTFEHSFTHAHTRERESEVERERGRVWKVASCSSSNEQPFLPFNAIRAPSDCMPQPKRNNPQSRSKTVSFQPRKKKKKKKKKKKEKIPALKVL